MPKHATAGPFRSTVLLCLALTCLWACSTATRGSDPVAAENALKVGVSTNAPPLIYRQGPDIVGLEAELAAELARFMGRPLHFVELDWQDQIPALLDKRTDIIMSGMSITPMREVRIAFTAPYHRTGQMALIRDADKMRFPTGYYGILGQSLVLRFGVIGGTTGELFVRKSFERAQKIIAYKSAEQAVEALARKQIDIFIHDGPIVLMLLAQNPSAGLGIVPAPLTEEHLAWGVRKNDPELLATANRFLAELKRDGRLDGILKRWIPFNN